MIDNPDKTQVIDPIAVQVAALNDSQNKRHDETLQRISQLGSNIQTLSGMLSEHMKSNLKMMQDIHEFIGQQMAYRLFREDVEENRLRLEIAQKNLEISHLEKQVNSLTEETFESDELRLNHEKQKLELEHLRGTLELLKTSKSSTQDKMKAMAPKTTWEKARETMILTAVSVSTGATLTGIFAFIWFLFRLYIGSQTGATP